MKNLALAITLLVSQSTYADIAVEFLKPGTLTDHNVTVGIYPIENSEKKTLVVCFLPENKHYLLDLRCHVILDDFQASIQQSPSKEKKMFHFTGEIETLKRLVIGFSTGTSSKNGFSYMIMMKDFIDGNNSKEHNKPDMATPRKLSD